MKKSKLTFLFLVSALIVSSLALISFSKKGKSAKPQTDKQYPREVMLSAQLVVVEIGPPNKKGICKLEARTRDCFKVYEYAGDSTSTVVLDWTLCANQKCLKDTIYYPGTEAYNKLDTLVKNELRKLLVKKGKKH